MGNKSSSISKTNITNKVINSLDLNLYCETVNETAVNVANDVYISHQASANVSNEFNVGKITVSGKDSKADLSLSNKGSVQMTSEIITDITNSVSNNISSQMVADITSMLDNETLNKLTEEMNQNIKNGMLSTAFGNKTENNQETNITNDITNSTNLSFENIVKNITNYNMTNNIEQKCLANSNTKNKVNADSVEVSEGGELVFKLENVIDVKIDCISNVTLVNNIASDLCNLANIKVVDEKKNKTTNDADIKNTQQVENGGIGEAIGGVIDNVGDAISGVFESSTTIIFIIGCVVCVVIIVAIIGIGYVLTDETGAEAVQGIVNSAVSATGPGKVKSVINKGGSIDYKFKDYLKRLFKQEL